MIFLPGVVPKPASEVAEDGEVLGAEHHHGGVRAVRRHGAALAAAPRDHPQECQGERQRRAVASR